MGVLGTAYYSFRFSCGNSKGGKAKKISFAASSWEVKLAVDRNLLKRRGRSIINSFKSEISSNYEGIFYFKKSALALPYEKLKELIGETLLRAKITKS